LDRQPPASFDDLWHRLAGNELTAVDGPPRCTTAGCRYYGLMEYSGRCYECSRNHSTSPGTPVSRRLITGLSISLQ